jgi:hypothetical protein
MALSANWDRAVVSHDAATACFQALSGYGTMIVKSQEYVCEFEPLPEGEQ